MFDDIVDFDTQVDELRAKSKKTGNAEFIEVDVESSSVSSNSDEDIEDPTSNIRSSAYMKKLNKKMKKKRRKMA